MSSRPSARGLALAFGIVIGAAVASPLSLTAAPPPPPADSSGGKVGQHGLIDSDADPGATCRYGYQVVFEGNEIYFNGVRRISVHPPFAFARKGKPSQRISWRATIQALRLPDEVWVRYARSRWQAREATPNRPADFVPMRVLTDPWEDDWAGDFRAKILMRWHKPDGVRVAGRATLFVHHYRLVEGAPFAVVLDRCGSTTG
jgi:hypothetical protein